MPAKKGRGNTLISLNARNTWGSSQPTIYNYKWWDDKDFQDPCSPLYIFLDLNVGYDSVHHKNQDSNPQKESLVSYLWM